MKKTLLLGLLLCASVLTASYPVHSSAQPASDVSKGIFDDDEEECTKNVQFTEETKERLQALMDEMYRLNQEIRVTPHTF